jgi:hypothetical protein
MIPTLFFYELGLVALVWLFLMLYWLWPNDPATRYPTRPQPRVPRKRSNEPKLFAGLTQRPHCALCEQDIMFPQVLPPAPPDPLPLPHRRPRTVDTSRHFCPHDGCDYRGWLGLGNLRANGLPTICQPPWVSFLPHLHDRLTTNSAGIIAGTIPQHGHQDAQQSVANSA